MMNITLHDATHRWVDGFNAIPTSLVWKLVQHGEDVEEVTVPAETDRVFLYGVQEEGRVLDYDAGTETYRVELDSGEVVDGLESFDFCPAGLTGPLPMWGTMWSFDDPLDEDWLEDGDGIRKMSEAGFRIFRQEDLGYVFGIDGAGYDFYEAHWEPLYRARGLRWHTAA